MPDPSLPVLELRGICKRFGRTQPWVLDGVDLVVGAGEVVQITGANGSGKSTLLRVAAGLARVGSGAVACRGRATFVPDRAPLAAPMTVAVYLAHQARLQGVGAAVRGPAVEDAIERHRLAPVASMRMGELSKGWTQRCLVAQAFLAEPAVVFLDEPWSGIDRSSRQHLEARFDEARSGGRALVMTTHHHDRLDDVRRLALRGGRLVTDLSSASSSTAVGARRVWLVERNGAAGLPDRWRRPVGLLGLEHDGDTLVVTIADDETGDAVLVRLLEAGFTPVRIGGAESR